MRGRGRKSVRKDTRPTQKMSPRASQVRQIGFDNSLLLQFPARKKHPKRGGGRKRVKRKSKKESDDSLSASKSQKQTSYKKAMRERERETEFEKQKN